MPEPDLRIQQANERTFLAWTRTGLALMAFGFVLARLVVWLRLEHPDRSTGVSAWLGVATLAAGVSCQAIGAIRFIKVRRAILEGRAIETSTAGPIAIAAVVGTIGVGAIIHLLGDL